jgi:hypothetical protein
MKPAALLLSVMVFGAGSLSPAEFTAGQSVYLLPMSNGLDQYLANRLSASGLFQVVADPKKAQAVFTDRLGEEFEQRLNALFPPVAEKPAAQIKGETGGAPAVSSFSRGKGTIFLVDVETRQVVWSAYEKPKNTTPDELDKTAQRIVDGLKKAVKVRKK